MTLLTLLEASKFLRMSRSSIYQRKDIPRFRRPGSRVILYDQQDLEDWMNRGRLSSDSPSQNSEVASMQAQAQLKSDDVDIPPQPIYHRNPRYR
jgi:predicted DNA-binding transcriptional regulator AlpA